MPSLDWSTSEEVASINQYLPQAFVTSEKCLERLLLYKQ
ncbi:hypothetical protein HDF23_005381 [Mucilaginibacter lappiensis]|uniref:Uncharacterized protein n=1 Tax=Mucilaginibacter lappiensis TaxID=354630 RepID=A0ABR6PTX9_9SPHI|nr:hypothetical protein [Mucilaginibacter lappiensis]